MRLCKIRSDSELTRGKRIDLDEVEATSDESRLGSVSVVVEAEGEEYSDARTKDLVSESKFESESFVIRRSESEAAKASRLRLELRSIGKFQRI